MVKMAKSNKNKQTKKNIGTSKCWLLDCLSVWYSSVQSSLCLVYDIVSVEDPGRCSSLCTLISHSEDLFSAPVPVGSRACVEEAVAACAPCRRVCLCWEVLSKSGIQMKWEQKENKKTSFFSFC